MDNIVLEIVEKEQPIPDTSNDEALARALFYEEQTARNQMFYQKPELTRQETRVISRVAAENRHMYNRFKMQFTR
tara:strand:- start:2083 stop:2307 length:225 start_codon:yes stop_codon:yes gene_type:complete